MFFRKILLSSVTILLFFFLWTAVPAHALGLGDAVTNLDNAVGANTDVGLSGDLPTTIATVVTAVLSLVGTIFLVLTIYAGILWMTAQGEEDKIEKAQKIVKATIIGLFITLGAYAITAFVAGRLSGGSAVPNETIGCCVGKEDNTICAPNSKESDCSAKATWIPGACPQTCK